MEEYMLGNETWTGRVLETAIPATDHRFSIVKY